MCTLIDERGSREGGEREFSRRRPAQPIEKARFAEENVFGFRFSEL
jgi:hypothetical protein